MDKKLHLTFYLACDYLISMLGLKLNHIIKRRPLMTCNANRVNYLKLMVEYYGKTYSILGLSMPWHRALSMPSVDRILNTSLSMALLYTLGDFSCIIAIAITRNDRNANISLLSLCVNGTFLQRILNHRCY